MKRPGRAAVPPEIRQPTFEQEPSRADLLAERASKLHATPRMSSVHAQAQVCQTQPGVSRGSTPG